MICDHRGLQFAFGGSLGYLLIVAVLRGAYVFSLKTTFAILMAVLLAGFYPVVLAGAMRRQLPPACVLVVYTGMLLAATLMLALFPPEAFAPLESMGEERIWTCL